MSSINGSIVIDTLTNGSLTTSLVCLNYPLNFFGKDFWIGLICFPLSQLDVILGMTWIELNHVQINYFDNTMLFSKLEENTDSRFLFVGQVEMTLRENDQVLMMFESLRVEKDMTASDMPVVCEFLDVFFEDICDLPLEREVEFAIDLVPYIIPVSMAPYKMYASELGGLKKQLEDLYRIIY